MFLIEILLFSGKKRCLLCAHGISLLTWRVLSFSLLRGVRDGHRDYRITGSWWAPFAFFSANIREPPPLHGWNIDETRRRLPLSPPTLHNFLALCSIKNSRFQLSLSLFLSFTDFSLRFIDYWHSVKNEISRQPGRYKIRDNLVSTRLKTFFQRKSNLYISGNPDRQRIEFIFVRNRH